MPSVIPHTPVGIGLAQNFAEENVPWQEAQNRLQQTQQEGAYQRGELGLGQQRLQAETQEKQQEMRQNAVNQANELSLRARQISVDSALRGQTLSNEQTTRMATLQLQNERLQDLQGYRASGLQDKTQTLTDREHQNAMIDQMREQMLSQQGTAEKDRTAEQVQRAQDAAQNIVYQNSAKMLMDMHRMNIAALNKAQQARTNALASLAIKEGDSDDKEYQSDIKKANDAVNGDMDKWNDLQNHHQSIGTTTANPPVQTAKPLPRSMAMQFFQKGGSRDAAKALAQQNGFDPNNIVDDSTNVAPAQ